MFIYYCITGFSPIYIYIIYTSKSYLKKSITGNNFINKWLSIIKITEKTIDSIYFNNLKVIVLATGELI